MISTSTASSVTTMVLEKTEDPNISPRLLELRQKIRSEEYINSAILRIATVISAKLVENCEELKLREN